MDLKSFKENLAAHLPSQRHRPFICEGSPLKCEVFIVGINPATEISDFWSFWDDETGFDYTNWLESYKMARRLSGKRQVSPTRRNISIITGGLAKEGILALETNVYAKPTRRASEILQEEKVSAVFDLLLQTIKPKLLLLHGKETVKAVQKMVGFHIQQPNEAVLNGRQVKILTSQHLSFQFSKAKANALTNEIIACLADGC